MFHHHPQPVGVVVAKLSKLAEVTGPPNVTLSDPNENNGPETAAIMWSLFALCTIFLGLRVWCKFWRQNGLWWDDYALLGSWVCRRPTWLSPLGNGLTEFKLALLADIIFTTIMITIGYGKHGDHTKLEDVPTMATFGMLGGIVVVVAVVWSKTSFGITLLRISDGWVKKFVWFIIISMNILMGITPILHVANCRPVAKTFNPFLPGTCGDLKPAIIYDIFASGMLLPPSLPILCSASAPVAPETALTRDMYAGYSAAMDFVLAFLPIILLKDLQMRRKEKLGVGIAMSFGVL
jgi:hypothetical protein